MDAHTRKIFGLTVRKNSHPDMRRLRRESGDPSLHGNKFWKSSCITMDYFTEFPLPKGVRVLDLGCGWGLGGIYCAKQFDADVVSLDADPSVFPFAEYHAALNGVQIQTWQRRYEQLRKQDLANFDVIIGTDICFWDKMTAPLFNLTRRALQAGVELIVLVDPGRDPFRALAQQAEQKLDAVYEEWSVPHPWNASGCIMIATQ